MCQIRRVSYLWSIPIHIPNNSISSNLDSPVKDLAPLSQNLVCSVRFRDPKYKDGFIFPAKKLKGAKEPSRVLKPEDFNPQQNRNWRPQIGMAPATKRFVFIATIANNSEIFTYFISDPVSHF